MLQGLIVRGKLVGFRPWADANGQGHQYMTVQVDESLFRGQHEFRVPTASIQGALVTGAQVECEVAASSGRTGVYLRGMSARVVEPGTVK